MAINTKALRDRRPKSSPVELETTAGNKIRFTNPFKDMELSKSEELFAKMDGAKTVSDIKAIFVGLAKNGKADWDKFVADDSPTLEDLQDVLQGITEEFSNTTGTPGESKG